MLKLKLKLCKITQAKLAQRLSVSQQYIQSIFNGRSMPSAKLAKKIEQLTNGTISRLELLYPEDFEYVIMTKSCHGSDEIAITDSVVK